MTRNRYRSIIRFKLPNTVLMPHARFTREHYAHWYNGMLEDVRAWLDGNLINEIHAAE